MLPTHNEIGGRSKFKKIYIRSVGNHHYLEIKREETY